MRASRGDGYQAEVSFTDDRVGKLHDRLRDEFGAVDLIVVGDHGESLGDHDEESHGVFVYETTTRVPLILGGDGTPATGTRGDVVSTVRVAATLLELAGLDADRADFSAMSRSASCLIEIAGVRSGYSASRSSTPVRASSCCPSETSRLTRATRSS